MQAEFDRKLEEIRGQLTMEALNQREQEANKALNELKEASEKAQEESGMTMD